MVFRDNRILQLDEGAEFTAGQGVVEWLVWFIGEIDIT